MTQQKDTVCKNCGATFQCWPSQRGLYCSRACFNAVAPYRTHGQRSDPEYSVWRSVRNRCNNPKNEKYKYYGARGISVCERWDSYENFLGDMGLRPGKGYTIERVDNDGNYEPSNCKWATQAEQNKNKRNVYTPAQDQKIREAVALGLSFPQMAEYVGKPLSSVEARTYRIGLKSGRPPPPCRKYA